jgi:hypothetical protein
MVVQALVTLVPRALLPSLLEPATGACCRPATELLPGTTASLLPSLLPSTDTRFVKFKHVMDRVFAVATETHLLGYPGQLILLIVLVLVLTVRSLLIVQSMFTRLVRGSELASAPNSRHVIVSRADCTHRTGQDSDSTTPLRVAAEEASCGYYSHHQRLSGLTLRTHRTILCDTCGSLSTSREGYGGQI